tara:strand:- start:285 stop:1397 length:1113 start_codon:yes stop_codon:yes gene_type:complete
MFKPKSDPKIYTKSNPNTLDHKHAEITKQINENERNIPILENKLKMMKRKKNTTNDIVKRLEYGDEIKQIKKNLKQYRTERKIYLLNNSKYIFEYFEKKKSISLGNSKTVLLNNFFSKPDTLNTNQYASNCNDLIHKYMENIDPTFVNLNKCVYNNDICHKCSKGELIPVDNEGICVCNKCGVYFQHIVEFEKTSYKEPPKEVCYYVYKRINHFKEILAQFQAKETTYISDEVLDRIRLQIKKERVSNDELSMDKTKDILKKLGYSNYYEHISFIKEKLGIKPPVMTPELEERLCNLFIQIQSPYSKYCPNDRVNFLNYYYTVYKLCELIDQREFLLHFPMLKDREKRVEQDDIWKNICCELGWKFIPTL